MAKRKTYDDDDGRTIASMSDISRPSLMGFRGPEPQKRDSKAQGSFLFEEKDDQPPFTSEERRMYVLASLKASLLIAAAFIVGLGIAILVMILAWT